MKLWEKGYDLEKKVEDFTVGNDFLLDQALVRYDCIASIAHAEMLKKVGLLTGKECGDIVKTLNEVIGLESKGKFILRKEDEDSHTAIENYLTEKLGETGKKIHTGRSRNDQILAALRLYYKDEIESVVGAMEGFLNVLMIFSDKYGKIRMPGYTHMQKAMPSSVGLWAEAFIESMGDNKKLLGHVKGLIDQSPLGSGAGYGISLEVDREFTAKSLGFSKVQENPLYVQNSRGKFESSILHALSQIMLDLNRMASDVLLFSMEGLGYFVLPKGLCTGSSIMPNKRNPDVLEIVRAKYHQVVSCDFEVKGIIGNLISGYNRDLQLTKEPVMKGMEITKSSLDIMSLVIGKLQVSKDDCEKAITEELYATEKACGMVKEGIPFRDAYRKVAGKL